MSDAEIERTTATRSPTRASAEHQYRPQDVDVDAGSAAPSARSPGCSASPTLLLLGFCVAYFTIDTDATFLGWSAQNFAFGITLGGGAAADRRRHHPVGQEAHGRPRDGRDASPGSLLATRTASRSWRTSTPASQESGFGRRPMIRNSLLGADGRPGPAGHRAAARPRSAPPRPAQDGLEEGHARRQRRLRHADQAVRPRRSASSSTAEPAIVYETDDEGEPGPARHTSCSQAKSKAAVIVVRMRPEDITPTKGRENWGVDGILCYSKICTHVGCPISLWEQQTHHLLCPCHQSTFDLADNGKVIFGPAHRPLPQLPLGGRRRGLPDRRERLPRDRRAELPRARA